MQSLVDANSMQSQESHEKTVTEVILNHKRKYTGKETEQMSGLLINFTCI